MNIDVEEFYNFDVELLSESNDLIINARLKKDNEISCHLLNEFLLKKNLKQGINKVRFKYIDPRLTSVS